MRWESLFLRMWRVCEGKVGERLSLLMRLARLIVVFVVDSGKHKEKTYDAHAKVSCLLPAWVSLAATRQRRGRAGRVRAGKCWHLFPKWKLDELQE